MDPPAPPIVKEYYAKFWWMYFYLLIIVCIGKIVAADGFGAFGTGTLALIIWCTVRNNCSNMTQCCVFIIGFMCTMNTIFELIYLAIVVGGREESHTSCVDAKGSTVCTTTTETHDFFDGSQGDLYIWQSIMIIVSPVSQLIGAVLCYKTYDEYPMSLFSDDEEQPIRGRDTRGPGGPGGGGRRGNGGDGGGGNAGGGGAFLYGGDPPVFQGEGQRLGSST